MVVAPVSNIWFDHSGFSPGKTVTCKANGYPRPTVHWIRTSDSVTVGQGAKLVVKSANHTYMCIATNSVRGQTYTIVSAIINYSSVDNTSTGIVFVDICCLQYTQI